MIKKILASVFTFFATCSVFSQTAPDIIVDSSANSANKLVYNSGEVFVVFTNELEETTKKNNESHDEKTIEGNGSTQSDIGIHPNPVTDILYLTIPEDISVNRIILYDAWGKIVLNQRLTSPQLDLSSLAAGVYMLTTDFSETQTFRIIKQ